MISVPNVLMLGHAGVYLEDSFITLLCKKCEARFHFSRTGYLVWGGGYTVSAEREPWRFRQQTAFEPGTRST